MRESSSKKTMGHDGVSWRLMARKILKKIKWFDKVTDSLTDWVKFESMIPEQNP